jgi:predicted transcriptional regulator
MRTLTVRVSESTHQVLARDAKARQAKPEDIAQAAIEDYVRSAVLLDRRFRDAAAEVDRRLADAPA